MDIQDTDFQRLIPELKLWNDGSGIDIHRWIGCEGDHKHLIGYARILWPHFIEHDDCIFREHLDTKNYQGWLARMKGNKTEVEAVMNHQHIVDLFSRSHKERPTREVVCYLGQLMKEIWQAKLDRDFPSRRVKVTFFDLDDILESHITFFQER